MLKSGPFHLVIRLSNILKIPRLPKIPRYAYGSTVEEKNTRTVAIKTSNSTPPTVRASQS